MGKYTYISQAIVNFAIANFRDRALIVISWFEQFIRDMETQESVEALATTGVR